MHRAIPFMQLRGGSSKGLYFTSADLSPTDLQRDSKLLEAMGGSDTRQIDGLGGGDPLTSKVAIVSVSERKDADLDYLFLQVVVGEDRVDTTPNCGNILAGVVPFAIEAGLLKADADLTVVIVHMVNSGMLCEVIIQTPGHKVRYDGDVKIDGVPGTAAPIICNYLETAGSLTGALFPTGNTSDIVQGVEVTCIDNGMPVVLLKTEDFGITGYESRNELNANEDLKQHIEQIRIAIGPRMNLGDISRKVVPKMSLISAPLKGGNLNTRTFIPHVCHASIGVLGAVSVATACLYKGSIADGIAVLSDHNDRQLSIEHPTGEFLVNLETQVENGELLVKRAGLVRTARLLSRGELYISADLFD